MKRKQEGYSLARIKTVLEGDRLNVSADLEKMLSYDLTCVLRGYFDFSSNPTIQITPVKGGYGIEISFVAGRIKNGGVSAV